MFRIQKIAFFATHYSHSYYTYCRIFDGSRTIKYPLENILVEIPLANGQSNKQQKLFLL
jgi:hypothetical protein